MTIHNTMEDVVLAAVRDVFMHEELTSKKDFCHCEQCRLDVVCYVLNQVPSKYIVSGRGLAYLEADYLEKIQRDADLASLINRGIELVSKIKRPHPEIPAQAVNRQLPVGPYFNIPTVTGRLFTASRFEPVYDAQVSLLYEGKLLGMMSTNWSNPFPLNKNNPGRYNFLPFPHPAQIAGIEKEFEFQLLAEHPQYEPLTHYFKFSMLAEATFIDYFRIDHQFHVEDLYLVPR
jgi:competence protein ComFB